MSERLIITESTQKGQRASASWPGGRARGLPTNGYILIPPRKLDPLGVRANLTDVRVVRTPEWLGVLRTALSEARDVVIATDPDAEGEVIAQDVARILYEVAPTKKVVRARMVALDRGSIQAAANAAVSMNPEQAARSWPDANPGHVRRVIDRICAGVFGSAEEPVGRVMSGFLHLANSVPPIEAVSLHDSAPGPGNLADLLLAEELADLKLVDIYNEAQGLYESGALSYPRTASRQSAQVFRQNGIQPGEGAHPALHITVDRKEALRIKDYAHSEPPGMPNFMRVLVAVERRTTGGMRRRPTDADPEARAILRLISEHGLGRPSTWANFCTTQANRGIYDPVSGLTTEGKRYLKWQPDWLDAGFSSRMERQLTTELPPSEQVRAILASLPLKEQYRVKDAIDRAGANLPAPRKAVAAPGPGNVSATRAGLITA